MSSRTTSLCKLRHFTPTLVFILNVLFVERD